MKHSGLIRDLSGEVLSFGEESGGVVSDGEMRLRVVRFEILKIRGFI